MELVSSSDNYFTYSREFWSFLLCDYPLFSGCSLTKIRENEKRRNRSLLYIGY